MNPNDEIQDGQSVETPVTSPVEPQTPDENQEENPSGASPVLSPEEESWKRLSGPSQERFRQITRENNYLRTKLSEVDNKDNSRSTYKPEPVIPEVAEAVRRLSDVGIATKEEVEQTVNNRLGGLVYQMELDRLSSKYDGQNGLPQFDKDEYEDYLARHPQYKNYAPEDVYSKMYEPEILEYKLQHLNKPMSQPTPSLKPTKTQVREEPLSPDLIEQRLKEPDGAQWYERNKEKINTVLAKTNVEAW